MGVRASHAFLTVIQSCLSGGNVLVDMNVVVLKKKLCAFRILDPNLKTINLTFGSLSPILYVK